MAVIGNIAAPPVLLAWSRWFRTRNLTTRAAAMGEEITLGRGEPRGGGSYPLVGQQSNDQFVSAGFAWNVIGG